MKNIPALPDEAAFGIAEANNAAWKIEHLVALLCVNDVTTDERLLVFVTEELEETVAVVRKNLARVLTALRTEDVTLEAA